MATIINLRDIARYEGQEVTARGWVYNRTDKGKLQFIQLRDGTGIAQCVAFKKDLPENEFESAGKLTQESSIIVTGLVRKDERAPGIPGGYEIGIKKLELIQMADDYPITPKEHRRVPDGQPPRPSAGRCCAGCRRASRGKRTRCRTCARWSSTT